MEPRQIAIQDYTYELPQERIAAFPLPERDASRLLVYRDGDISDRLFRDLPEALESGTQLIVNNTRVVEARMLFDTPTGARVEVFYLEPADLDVVQGMAACGQLRVKALVGNAKKWREGLLRRLLKLDNGKEVELEVALLEKTADHNVLQLSWSDPALPFADVLQAAGNMPLPPYIKRDVQSSDAQRYQTVYAQHQGSVAAPTAGLHFTDHVLQQLGDKGIQTARLTLHVGAGTFRPVKAATMAGHEMHGEYLDVDRHLIYRLAHVVHPDQVVAVGTTSLRTLESLYWMGVQLLRNPGIEPGLPDQWYAYDHPSDVPAQEALAALYDHLEKTGQTRLFAKTQLLIAPGYKVRMARGLITNFHQPQSTLLLLVAAFIGPDWRKVYNHALGNDYRFLSYGDSSLLWRTQF
ncbi:MAG: S-adenosylmethionine:tRNA ribosyltransferase-isomerase [Saprospiraceae bacterium]|nr:S-adenosylmethionine:tRNA ribosyltransferase-isomerase [Saprospiraceae bacterium]